MTMKIFVLFDNKLDFILFGNFGSAYRKSFCRKSFDSDLTLGSTDRKSFDSDGNFGAHITNNLVANHLIQI